MLSCNLCWNNIGVYIAKTVPNLTGLSAYEVKNNNCLFGRLFKVKKKGVFLLGISFFVLEILGFCIMQMREVMTS